MKYCADTWFLIQLSKRSEKAERIIKETTTGKDHLIIPSITFSELTRKFLKSGKKMDVVLSFVESLEKNPKIQISNTTKEIVLESGKLSYTFNMPTVDSIIASTAEMMNCNAILSKDSHYVDFCKRNNIKLMNW